MRKAVAAVAAAGSLLAGALLAGLGAAAPALAQSGPITLLCSPGSNGGTPTGGVCVLPAAAAGQPYPDKATSTSCAGSCARRWPPVAGSATAGPGGDRGTGNDHPPGRLDTAPGQDRGNNLNASGGV